ncbi:MAG: YihY/virulence factor BrkB family protein, partial [Bryobacteraceae bacterium]
MSEVSGSTPHSAQSPGSRLAAVVRHSHPTLNYWMETEVHVYAFSIAANVLLSFFPFLIVIFFLCREVLGWHTAVNAITIVLGDYFPGELGEFVKRNLVANGRSLRIFSVFLLLFTANGIFEPLEVALNRAWGIAKNRSFVKNQIISLALIFA